MQRMISSSGRGVGSVFACLILLASSCAFACGIRWTQPKSFYDGVDSKGFVLWSPKIGELDLGSKLILPIYAQFESDWTGNSPYLGSGWRLPLLEAAFVQVDENTFEMRQPGGWVRTFHRNKKYPTLLNGGNWQAEIKGDTIVAWAECGDKITFHSGKIGSMSLSGRTFDFVYSGNKVMEIREGGISVLKVVWNDLATEALGIDFNGHKINFARGEKPRVQNIGGLNVVAGIDRSLIEVADDKGLKKTFNFAVDSKVQPVLTTEGHVFTWDPRSFKVLSDGSWNYESKLVDEKSDTFQISRASATGEKESWVSNREAGEEKILRASGIAIIRTWFTTGNIAGQPRGLTESKDGKEFLVRKWNYDEKGRLLRTQTTKNQNTFEIAYKYSPGQKVAESYKNGTLQEINLYNEAGLLMKGYYKNGKSVDFGLVNGIVKGIKINLKGDALDKVQSDIDAQIQRARADVIKPVKNTSS